MSRNLDFRNETFHPYAKALGELALAWNDFHVSLSSVYWAALKIPNKMTPQTMWNALKSDRAQRDMLEALVDLNVIGHNLPTNVRCEIKWVLHEARKLEDTRNDALHSPLLSDLGTVFAWYQLGHVRAEKLANKDLLKVFGWFYDTVIILRQYSELLAEAIGQPDAPLPKRPSLPNRGDSKQSPSDCQ